MSQEIELLSSQIQTLTWAIGLGFTALGSLTLYLNTKMGQRVENLDESLNKKMDTLKSDLSSRIDGVEKSLGSRIDKLDEKFNTIALTLARIEGAMSNKECCVLKHTHDKEAK